MSWRNRFGRHFAGCMAALMALGVAVAHEARPGYLELRETATGEFDVIWKQPANGEMVLRLVPVFPPDSIVLATGPAEMIGDALVSRFRLVTVGGLNGRRLTIAGLENTMTDVLVRLFWRDGTVETRWARAAAPSVLIGADSAKPWRLDFLRRGIWHIWSGIDHLLFILGLVLLIRGRTVLLTSITAFTVAHSLTFTCAALGHLSVPGPPLEVAIALSIVFLAREIVTGRSGATSLSIRRPWIVAFAFGLLHGFGFASGLTTIGLSHDDMLFGVFLFNVGVEIGQIAFILPIVGVLHVARCLIQIGPVLQRRTLMVSAYAIGVSGAFWSIERIFLFRAGGF